MARRDHAAIADPRCGDPPSANAVSNPLAIGIASHVAVVAFLEATMLFCRTIGNDPSSLPSRPALERCSQFTSAIRPSSSPADRGSICDRIRARIRRRLVRPAALKRLGVSLRRYGRCAPAVRSSSCAAARTRLPHPASPVSRSPRPTSLWVKTLSRGDFRNPASVHDRDVELSALTPNIASSRVPAGLARERHAPLVELSLPPAAWALATDGAVRALRLRRLGRLIAGVAGLLRRTANGASA